VDNSARGEKMSKIEDMEDQEEISDWLIARARRRVFIRMLSWCAVFATIFCVGYLVFYREIQWLEGTPKFLVLVAVGVAAFIAGLGYLQSGGIQPRFTAGISDRNLSAHLSMLDDRLDRIEFLNEMKSTSNRVDIDRDEIANGVIASLKEEVLAKAFSEKIESLKSHIQHDHNERHFADACTLIINRMKREVADLRLRANVNLMIGIITTCGGLVLLWYTISILDTSDTLKAMALEGSTADSAFIKSFAFALVPRVMLVIFIEVFAYFFLRLYKEGLREIKYFQNELTNLESRLIALYVARESGNPESVAVTLNSLAMTERNFILSNGQTTVELERAKSENQITRVLVKGLSGFASRRAR
jgi:hypothetical protein